MEKSRYFTKQLPFYCLAATWALLMFPWHLDAAPRESRENGRSQKEERKEQMKQEARPYAEGINKALGAILEPTAKNQRPNKAVVDGAKSALDQSKRYLSVFDDRQKAQFMLLQAWTSFYQGSLPQALNWSMRAAKTNEGSQDAWNSQALFCMLSEKRPMVPRKEKPKKQPERTTDNRRPRRNKDLATQAPTVKPYSENGTLKFDLLGLRTELLKEQFGRLELVSVGGQQIEYKPQTNTLCMLFWQTDEKLSDANDLATGTGQVPAELQEAVNFIPRGIPRSYDSQNTTLQTQRDYVSLLKEACLSNPEIQFVQINTNQAAAAKAAAAKALKDATVEQAGALIFAADPASKAQNFMGLKAEKPFLAVIDKEGKTKYAGTASGFMPAFILTELTGVEIDLDKQKQQEAMPGYRGVPTSPEMTRRMMDLRYRPTAKKPVVDPNKPTADPNAPGDSSNTPVSPAGSAKRNSDFPTDSVEEQVRVENLLRSAQLEIEGSRKIRGKNPGVGIEACRQIMKDYPNTEYADRAREWLRKVPDRYKKDYEITDEELGY